MSYTPVSENASDKTVHLLKLIAIGLLKQEQVGLTGQPQPVTLLDQHLRLGWEELCFACFREGELPPRTLPAFIRLLHKPVAEWPVIGKTLDAPQYRDPLLSNGIATPFCIALGEPFVHSYNPRLELEDENFRRLRDACAVHHDTEQYSKARTFIVRDRVLSDPYVDIVTNLDWKPEIRDCLADCYENIPPACIKIHNGKRSIALCPHCGWTLQWRGEEAMCHADGICQAVCGDLSQSEQWIPYIPGMARTKEGVQRFVAAPEITLIALYDKLAKEWGLNCTLFPELDSYDLLVKFPDGKAWAVDVKDRRSAVRLALSLLPFRYVPLWDRAFYVFPDYHADAAYLNEFGSYWPGEHGVSYCGASKFMELMREELKR